MKSFLLGASLAVSGVLASEFSLAGLPDSAISPSRKVVALKFGGEERRRADGMEEMTVTLANGEEVVVPLTEFEELEDSSCGSYHDGDFDMVVTGCYGEDRSVTIGGQGSWDYEADTDVFRRVDVDDEKCTSLIPPEDDMDAAMMNRVRFDHEASGRPISANLDESSQFKMEVRYYYEESLLERYDNDHAKAKAAVREMHEHAKVMMRHPTIGRAVHLDLVVDPVFIDTNLHAHVNTLNSFMRRLKELDVCNRDIAFHHLITDRRQDGISGVAWVGTVCHDDCWNSGITEIWASTAGSASTLAHEFGHNLGALHTFDRQNAGRNCDGIMSYGDSPDTWSDCSREKWTADYNVFVEAHGQARADRCFRPTSGGVSPNPRPTPRPVQSPTPRPVQPPVQRPTPRPVQPTPTPPIGEVVVNVGSSTRSIKVVSVAQTGLRCPSTVTRANWLGGYTWGDRFRVSVSGRRITVQRLDRNSSWGMNLRFKCTTGSSPTPTPPTPTPPSPPTSGSCRCSGRTNSSGQGGANCATRSSRGSWCYTNLNACSDGVRSRAVSGQEFSYLACKSGSRPVPAPTPTPPSPRPTPKPGPAPPAPTPSPPRGCRCSGRTNSSGRGGADCRTRGSRGSWCFTELNACSDGIRSRSLPGQEYSYLACRSQSG